MYFKISLLSLFVVTSSLVLGQNLIPNGDFESRSCCPSSPSSTDNGQLITCAIDWRVPGTGTSDYWNTCGATSLAAYSPPQLPPPSGQGYIGLYIGFGAYNEYAGNCLTSNLISGNSYTFTFRLGTGGTAASTQNIALYGATNCTHLTGGLSGSGTNCPSSMDPNWVLLGQTAPMTPLSSSWLSGSITFTAPSNISAIIVGGNCSPTSTSNIPDQYYFFDDLSIIAACTPGSNTTPTTAICESGTKTLTATTSDGTWSIVSGGGTIVGTTYTPPNVSSNTSVTVRYTDACGNTSDQTFTVNVQEPAVNTTTTTSICEGSDKTLTGTPSGGTWNIVSGGGSITGSTYTAPIVAGATTVTVRYTVPANGACPASTDDVTFTVDDNVPPSNTTNTDTICEGGTKALTGTPGGGTFTLLNGSGSITGTTYTAGSISSPDLIEIEYASPAAGSCPAGEDTISFVVVPLPEPIITSVNDTMCEGTTRLLTGTPAGGVWSVVSGTATITNDTLMPTGAGTVVVQYMVTNANGCSDSVTQTIESISAPLDPMVTASSDTVCRGEQVTITGSGSGVGVTYNVYSTLTGSSWLGVTPYTISPILTTTYYIDANNGTCMNNGGRQPITITVNPLPTVNTNGDQTICPTDQVILTATGGGTYLWSTGSTNDSIIVSPLVDTTYYVTVTNSNNCSVTDSVQVTILNGTIVQAEDDSATVNTAVDTTIDVFVNDNGDPNAITILSGPNNGTGTITSGILSYRSADDFVGVDTIVYELCDLVCPLLCDTAIVYLTVERDLWIPEFFSPNGDNINDEFIILGLEKYPSNSIKIFNRWGSLVYQNTPFTAWNGISEGIILSSSSVVPTGTYYYILDLGDNSEPVAGYLIIK